MDKETYIERLRIALNHLDTETIERVVAEYEQFIQEARAKGMNEQDVIAKLRRPEELARDYAVTSSPTERRKASPGKQLFVAIALVCFNLFVVLSFLLSIYASLFALYAVFGVFILTPIIMIFQANHLFEWSVSFILAGIGLVFLPLTHIAFRFVVRLTKQYIGWNVQVWKESAYE